MGILDAMLGRRVEASYYRAEDTGLIGEWLWNEVPAVLEETLEAEGGQLPDDAAEAVEEGFREMSAAVFWKAYSPLLSTRLPYPNMTDYMDAIAAFLPEQWRGSREAQGQERFVEKAARAIHESVAEAYGEAGCLGGDWAYFAEVMDGALEEFYQERCQGEVGDRDAVSHVGWQVHLRLPEIGSMLACSDNWPNAPIIRNAMEDMAGDAVGHDDYGEEDFDDLVVKLAQAFRRERR